MNMLLNKDKNIDWEIVWGVCLLIGLCFIMLSGNSERKPTNTDYKAGKVEVFEKREQDGILHKTGEYHEFDNILQAQ